MNAFIGRLGVPSSRLPGRIACLATNSSGLGVVEGDASIVVSETLGEIARAISLLCAAGLGARMLRRMLVALGLAGRQAVHSAVLD